jgi:alkylglycerol monooxygenase
MWAAHVVHHSSDDYNLSTALRQTSTGALFGWIPYVPMAIAGVPPSLFVAVALIDLLYQFWVRTEQIKKLGWFDQVFVSPSNHRVHHGVNDAYLDKNYGGILVVWDGLFGSFEPEHDDEPVVYGTRAPLRSFNPLWANLEVYAQLFSDSWQARGWLDKLKVWWMPPGWRPAELQARRPKPDFAVATRRRLDPTVSKPIACYALLQFAAILGLAIHFLDVQRVAATGVLLIYLAFLSASLLGVGAVLEGRRWGWAIELGRHFAAVGVLLATGAWLAGPPLASVAIVFGVIWLSASALAAAALASVSRASLARASDVRVGVRSGLGTGLGSPTTEDHQPQNLGSDAKQQTAPESRRVGQAGGAQ